MIIHVAFALFAVYMLARYGPRAVAALRGRRRGDRFGAAMIPVLNVVLALAILVVAVKGLAGTLISR